MAKAHWVEIAGRKYELRYRLSTRKAIESSCGGKALSEIIFGGVLEEQAWVVAHGMKHKDRDATANAVIELFEEHVDKGGEWDIDIYPGVVRAVFENRLLGRVNQEELERIIASLTNPGEAAPKE